MPLKMVSINVVSILAAPALVLVVAAGHAAASPPPDASPCAAAPAAEPSDPPFPLDVDSERGVLVDAAGAPFFVHGDAAWSLIAELTPDEVTTYLDARRASGFNSLLVSLIEHEYATNAPANAAGVEPFAQPGDFASPVDEYFDHAVSVVREAAARGMVVLLAPAYVGIDATDGWYADMEVAGVDVLRDYGRYVGERFAAEDNVVWVNSGDQTPPDLALVDAVAEGIAETDGGALHTAHMFPDHTAAEVLGDRDWLDLNTVYTYHNVYEEALIQYRDGARPFILIESTYENESEATTQLLRRHAYQALLTGANGHVFGNNPIWHFSGPGLYDAAATWQDELDSPGTASMEQLVALWTTLPWWDLEPDEGRLVTSDLGEGDGRGAAAIACDGRFAVAYVDDALAPLTLDGAALVGAEATARWIDPTTGEEAAAQAFDTAAGPVDVMAPGANAGGDTDWVVVVETA